jgi:hypothetical protein
MKITKQGIVPAPIVEVLYGKCSNCGCEFETDRFFDVDILPYSRSNPIFQRKCPTEKCLTIITLTKTKE